MEKIKLTPDLEISRIIHGHWRLLDWKLTKQEFLKLMQQTIDIGVNTFDHADIYGDYECEKVFGESLKLKPALRDDIKLITKCGINLLSDKYPLRKIKYYDYSYKHIIGSVENSLRNMSTDYIDILLLHRPSPLLNPEEVASAFSDLKKAGKVLHFGVSNFESQEYEMLDSYLESKLVTNQIEISPYHLGEFKSGNINFLLKNKICPMAWSPLGGGKILFPKDKKGLRLLNTLREVAQELNICDVDTIVYSWLLKHPSGIAPVIGTKNIDRIKKATESIKINMSTEQWFKIYNASEGVDLP